MEARKKDLSLSLSLSLSFFQALFTECADTKSLDLQEEHSNLSTKLYCWVPPTYTLTICDVLVIELKFHSKIITSYHMRVPCHLVHSPVCSVM